MPEQGRVLAGKRVLVTRAPHQAATLADALTALGAVPVRFPAIQIAPLADFTALDSALCQLPSYDWVVFTSTNGVEHSLARLGALCLDLKYLEKARLCAIGPATAKALLNRGLMPTLVPREFTTRGVAEELGQQDISGKRLLLLRAQVAPPTLRHALTALGACVDEVAAYRTLPGGGDVGALIRRLQSRQIDVTTFTSSSTAESLAESLGEHVRLLGHTLIACIGPVTAETVRGLGLPVDVVASEHTVPGLVRALAEHFSRI